MKKYDYLKQSLTLKFSQRARELNQVGEKIISLGLGEPVFDTPEEIIENTYKAMLDGFTKYSSPNGIVPLRKEIARKLKKDNSINADFQNIVITAGAKMACLLAFMAILEPNDEVINITPCYVSYIPQLRIAEPSVKIQNIKLKESDFSLDIQTIEKEITNKTKLLIINSPHNPTGKIIAEEEIRSLVHLANKYDFYILSDEIYERLIYSNTPHVSPASIDGGLARTIVINGFSKAYSMTGFRIGYGLFPEKLTPIIIKLQQHMLTNIPVFIQKGALVSLNLDKNFLNNYKEELKKSSDYTYKTIKNKTKLSIVKPQGGLFAFLNITNTNIFSDEFSLQLLSKKKVATTPGIAFGKDWDKYVRISLAAGFDVVKEGINRIVDFVNGKEAL